MIPFNRPYLTGNELQNIEMVLRDRKLSGDGQFTKKCHEWFEKKYNFPKTLLTTSCTDALEMCAILLNLSVGDEVILPSYTFVSTANAFALRGAVLRFADSEINNPNIDPKEIERLINVRTKAIVVVHYAGVSCNMKEIMEIANFHDIPVIEDAAQAINSYYDGQPLGSLGKLASFSFHETKNIICGEGGLLVINDEEYSVRAEIIREKGTNRSSFFRGDVDKYGWVDIGSSFLPSDMLAAFLYAQTESIDFIQRERLRVWNRYYSNLHELAELGFFKVAKLPEFATNNAHMFYLVCRSLEDRTNLIQYLKINDVMAVFHYQSLHKSEFFSHSKFIEDLPNADKFTNCLVRLPLYVELSNDCIDKICNEINKFYKS